MDVMVDGRRYELRWKDKMPPDPILVAADGSILEIDSSAEKRMKVLP